MGTNDGFRGKEEMCSTLNNCTPPVCMKCKALTGETLKNVRCWIVSRKMRKLIIHDANASLVFFYK